VRRFLATLKKMHTKEDICIVCGEPMKNTLDTHHLDGNRKNNDPDNLVTVCASCHRIIDKAKSPEEALLDLRERHKRMDKKSF
jgi:5-methylcytosine-specific restriction endonuclease McrA